MRYFGKNKRRGCFDPPPPLLPRPFNLTKFHFKILEQCDKFVQSQQRHYNEIKMTSPYHQMMPLLLTFDKLQFFLFH